MKLAIVGLGYVGLPLAVALSRKFEVVGYERDKSRVAELKAGRDSRGEVADDDLASAPLTITAVADDIAGADIYFITVPTPIDESHLPDLTLVRDACRMVGAQLKEGAIVVLESSVYPGVTEEICGPELESTSGLTVGRDFHIAHSPERVNPGDGLHSITKIAKVVGADDPALAEKVAEVYRAVVDATVHIAPNIKVAELSKILENTQRDMNIALVNEAAMICHGLGISIYDVLDAATTKWNFARFEPGLVGGHCIGVDPYYLVEIGRRHGVDPELIRAARDRNEFMPAWLANEIHDELARRHPDPKRQFHILILGVTFKENVPDIRNSKVVAMRKQLERRGVYVDMYDPVADREDVLHEYGITLQPEINGEVQYDCIIGAVAHDAFKALRLDDLCSELQPGGFVFDLKRIWPHDTNSGPEFVQL